MEEQEQLIYLPVDNLKFEDLYDWGIPTQKCKTHSAAIRNFGRQDSQTGSVVMTNETNIALFRVADTVYAINENCPHAGGPLHVGDIETLPDYTLCVRCPWHSWRFDLRTGYVRHPRGHKKQATVYPVCVKEDGSIFIGFKQLSSKYFRSDYLD